jgi:hypothetical protein
MTQEPVAWMSPDESGLSFHKLRDDWVPLYTMSREQEFECPRCGHCCAQREWVGLTDAEMEDVWNEHGWYVTLFQKVEAKLKEKNT